jgi:UDP-N-acetylmuramate dehydrogenase
VNADNLEIKENFPLAPLTTFNIGGPARYFAAIRCEEELRETLKFADSRRLSAFILGGGSNILVSDRGFPGVVISNQILGFQWHEEGSLVAVTVGSGEDWDQTVEHCVRRNWAGIECLSGIPGKAGAAPIQNIGAYGQSVSDTIVQVRAFDLASRSTVHFDNAGCQFQYRESAFNTTRAGRYVVMQVTFRLRPNGQPTLTYHDLKNLFPNAATVTLSALREAVIQIRAQKGMVLLPGFETYKSVGSFFKNPVTPSEIYQSIKAKISSSSRTKDATTPWSWALPDGKVKISAAYLIEQADFSRGYRHGGVGISPKHALALVNCDNGTAAEIIALARMIQQRVNEKFGVLLKPEAQMVGFEVYPLLE